MKKVEASFEESLHDFTLRVYGRVEGLGFLLEDNPELTFDSVLTLGQELLVREEFSFATLQVEQQDEPVQDVSEASVLAGHTLVDLALQEYGSVESLFTLAEDNNIALNATPTVGAKLKVYESKVVNAKVRDFFRRQDKKITTGTVGANPPLGIGDMIIEQDFIVQ